MNILTEKQLVNLSTQRLLEIKRKLNKIVGVRRHEAEKGNASEADYKFLREHEDFYALVKEQLSHREHIEDTPKVKHNHDKRARRDARSKKQQYE